MQFAVFLLLGVNAIAIIALVAALILARRHAAELDYERRKAVVHAQQLRTLVQLVDDAHGASGNDSSRDLPSSARAVSMYMAARRADDDERWRTLDQAERIARTIGSPLLRDALFFGMARLLIDGNRFDRAKSVGDRISSISVSGRLQELTWHLGPRKAHLLTAEQVQLEQVASPSFVPAKRFTASTAASTGATPKAQPAAASLPAIPVMRRKPPSIAAALALKD